MWQLVFLVVAVSAADVRFNISSKDYCKSGCDFLNPDIWDNRVVPVNNSDVYVITDFELSLYFKPEYTYDLVFNSFMLSGPISMTQTVNITYSSLNVTRDAMLRVINYSVILVTNLFSCGNNANVSLFSNSRIWALNSTTNFTMAPSCTLYAEGASTARIVAQSTQIDGNLLFADGTILRCESSPCYLGGQTNISGHSDFKELIMNADATFAGGLVVEGLEVNVGKIVLVSTVFQTTASNFFLHQGSALFITNADIYITIDGGVNTGLGSIEILSSNFTLTGRPEKRFGLNSKITFHGRNQVTMIDVIMNNPQFVDIPDVQSRFVLLRPKNLLINSSITIPGQIIVDVDDKSLGIIIAAPLHTSSIIVKSGIAHVASDILADDYILVEENGLLRVNCSKVAQIQATAVFASTGTYQVLTPHRVIGILANNGTVDLQEDVNVTDVYFQFPGATLLVRLSIDQNESTVIYTDQAMLDGKVEYDVENLKEDASFLILQSASNLTGETLDKTAYKSSLSNTKVITMEVQFRNASQVFLVFEYNQVEAWFVWGFSAVCALVIIIAIIVYFVRDQPHSAYLS